MVMLITLTILLHVFCSRSTATTPMTGGQNIFLQAVVARIGKEEPMKRRKMVTVRTRMSIMTG